MPERIVRTHLRGVKWTLNWFPQNNGATISNVIIKVLLMQLSYHHSVIFVKNIHVYITVYII